MRPEQLHSFEPNPNPILQLSDVLLTGLEHERSASRCFLIMSPLFPCLSLSSPPVFNSYYGL